LRSVAAEFGLICAVQATVFVDGGVDFGGRKNEAIFSLSRPFR
jgi:hypothetical protein